MGLRYIFSVIPHFPISDNRPGADGVLYSSLLVISHTHDLYMKYDIYAWNFAWVRLKSVKELKIFTPISILNWSSNILNRRFGRAHHISQIFHCSFVYKSVQCLYNLVSYLNVGLLPAHRSRRLKVFIWRPKLEIGLHCDMVLFLVENCLHTSKIYIFYMFFMLHFQSLLWC
jgi:hypothetical protein